VGGIIACAAHAVDPKILSIQVSHLKAMYRAGRGLGVQFAQNVDHTLHGFPFHRGIGRSHFPDTLCTGLILQKLLGYNFSVAVWVGYIALFGIAVETGVVMVVYLHEALNRRLASGKPVRHEDIEEAIIEDAVHRFRPKVMTVSVVLASLVPILWETGIGSDVMKPIAASLVGA